MSRAYANTLLKAMLLGLLTFAIIGPLANLALWAFAERWYFPYKLPVTWGFRYWEVVFRPTGVAMQSLEGIAAPAEGLNSDIHADAAYRAHLIGVMAKRAVAAATNRGSTLSDIASAAASAIGLQS